MQTKCQDFRNKTQTKVQLKEEQMGFRRNRRSTDTIFTSEQLVGRNSEYNKNMYIAFVDQENSFAGVIEKVL